MSEKLDGEVRRRQIAQAALETIAKSGVRGLSMAGVARRVGLVPSGIYRHYAGKEEVLTAVLDSVRQRMQAHIEEICRQTDDPMERLHRMLMRLVAMVRDVQAMPRILFADGPNTGRRVQAYGMLQGILGQVGRIIADGQKVGVIRDDTPPQTLAVMLWGLFAPAVILWYASEGGFDVTRQVNQAWKVFCDGIRPQAKVNA